MNMRSASLRPALVALALFASTGPALRAQGAAVPADSVLRGFHGIGDYVLVVDGKEVAAEIYQLDNPPTVLVVSPTLGSPVLLSPRTRGVETVPLLKVAKRPDGTADVLADAVVQPAGRFDVLGSGEVSFKLASHAVLLREKPPLLGAQKLEALIRYSPEYGRLADEYQPSSPIVERLRKQTDPVEVQVYFGSWCPFCKQMVPRVMKVAQQLQGSRIQVGFYGLPREMSSDPKTKELELNGVPTAIIYRGGKEIGRITGQSWRIPELALNNVLIGAGSASSELGAEQETVRTAAALDAGADGAAAPVPAGGQAAPPPADQAGMSRGAKLALVAAVVGVPSLVVIGRWLRR
jgi:thiol-disulfide isomerase/thioredoxin